MPNRKSTNNDRGPGAPEKGLAKPQPFHGDRTGVHTAFARPRNPLDNRFVYTLISQRARGLSIGINLNPDKRCNFDCVYCEVNRGVPGREPRVNIPVMSEELERLLGLIRENKLRDLAGFSHLPQELLQLKEVALSGDGEPTLCPNLYEVVRHVVFTRARGNLPFFKIVFITNAAGLDLPEVARCLEFLAPGDEIWAKLDAGTQEYMDQVNRAEVPLWKVLANILAVGKLRPIIIQSLFPLINGEPPPLAEIEHYVQRLKELTLAGAQITMVQVYSAHRPPHQPNCEHLPLKTLSYIARRIREATGLKAEVF
jgi:wyosine [tRNA(Phe)-imidazoG37] synthetase (radical SAM superfamily)